MSKDLFGPGSNLEKRFVRDHQELVRRIEAFRTLSTGGLVVLTSGSFDIKHVGHDRYLELGKNLSQGGILVVGVDDDRKIAKRKGPDRPIVPEMERVEGLCHVRHVDLITLKSADAQQWELIGLVKPDILLITEETHDTEEALQKLEEFLTTFGGRYERVPPQAETSTTARLRRFVLEIKNKVKDRLQEVIQWIDDL